MAIDQLFWNPIFGLMFFSYLGVTSGHSMDQIKEKISNDLSTAVMGSWTVWIPGTRPLRVLHFHRSTVILFVALWPTCVALDSGAV